MLQELPNSKRTVHSKCCKASIILGGQIIAPYSYKCSKCGKNTELEYDIENKPVTNLQESVHGEDGRVEKCECYGKNEDLESGLIIIHKEKCPIHKQPIVNQDYSTVTTNMDINDIRRTLMRQKFLDLREKLAEQEHRRWQEWQKYCHSKMITYPDGRIDFPQEYHSRWERQIYTPYDKLSEKEKDSDREQVDRYWPLIEEILKVLE